MSNNRKYRTSWLQHARRESSAAAENRARQFVPFAWDTVGHRTSSARKKGRTRAQWALVLLPILLVGGATGTWAFVQHLDIAAAPAVEELKQDRPPAPAPAAAPAPRRPVRPLRKIAPAAPEKAPIIKRSRARRRSRGVRQRDPRTLPEKKRSEPRIIVVPGEVVGDDQVIIVSPPAKMKPLWTVESYKKKFGGR